MSIELRIKTSSIYMCIERYLMKLGRNLELRYKKLSEFGQIMVLILLLLICIAGIYGVSIVCRCVSIHAFKVAKQLISMAL